MGCLVLVLESGLLWSLLQSVMRELAVLVLEALPVLESVLVLVLASVIVLVVVV